MPVFIALGISLGIGLLIGLQRERTEQRLGGIRTFPLISILGTVCGLMGDRFGPWIIAAGFVALTSVLVVTDVLRDQRTDDEHGLTTEIAALLTFALGAYVAQGDRGVAVCAAGILVVLLHLKRPMHHFVDRMGPRDMNAIMQFVVITLIVLPLLPNRGYGPYEVLNPFQIWRIVVLIVGLSLGGYIVLKFIGERAGAILGGILGGMISSTASTVSYARRTKSAPKARNLAIVAVQLAGTIAYLRILLLVAAIAPAQTVSIAPPILAMFGWMAMLSGGAFYLWYDRGASIPETGNPAELRSALAFGAIYAVVLVAVAAVQQHFGSAGLYVVSIISGLTQMDAITVSVGNQLGGAGMGSDQGWRLLMVASLANISFQSRNSLGSRREAFCVGGCSALGGGGGGRGGDSVTVAEVKRWK